MGRVIQGLDNKASGRVGVQIIVTNLVTEDLKPESVCIKSSNIAAIPWEDESLESFLDGFEVVDSGDATLGRISVATRDYQEGELVLADNTN